MTVFFHVDAFSQSFARLTLYLLSPGADCISLSMEKPFKTGKTRQCYNGIKILA
jgi:hypothetical protein